MPFCPACREEYREGFSRCADCAVDLVAARPSAPSPVPAPAPTGGWSEVFHGDPQSADILRSLLETGGVKTIAPDAMMPQFRHSAPSTDGKVRIFVATTDLPKVQEILREDPLAQISENEEELVRFPCPCGQTLETPVQAAGSELQCPYCERMLTVPGIPKEVVPGPKAAPGKSGGRGFHVMVVQSPEGNLQHYGTILSPDLLAGKESIIPEVIFGSFNVAPSEVPTEFPPEGFEPNPKFVQVLHQFLVETVPQQPGFGAEAEQGGGDGWVYLFDQRTPRPPGDVPLEDILGGFEFKGGNRAGYWQNPNHLLYSQRGLFNLGESLNAAFLKYLTALLEEGKPH